jgi:hypothetical protein
MAIMSKLKVAQLENERRESKDKAVISVSDITSIIQAVCAVATAALTTYTLVNLILGKKKQNETNGTKSNSNGIRTAGTGTLGNSNSSSTKDPAN